MVQPDRATRGVRRPTPGAPSTRNNAPQVSSTSVPQQGAVTQEQVSLSLLDIVEELANHVPVERRPQVELLRRLAREKPDQQVKVKEQMLLVAGPEAMRAAVSAVVSKAGAAKTEAPETASAPAPAPMWSSSRPEPPMPPNLPAIFGSSASTANELNEFKAELLHAFHCTAPSCPVSKCAQLTTKIQRLRQHVSSCTNVPHNCLLCSIFTYMRDFHAPCPPCDDSAAPGLASALGGGLGGGLSGGGSSMMYADDLMSSKQLLPCWDRDKGKLAWLAPSDALNQVGKYTLAGGSETSDGRSSKRARTDKLSASPLGGGYSGLEQGVLHTQPGFGAFGGIGGQFNTAMAPPPMPRVPTAGAPAPSASAGAPSAAPPLPESLDFARMTSEMYGGMGGNGGHGKRGARGRSAQLPLGGLDLSNHPGNLFLPGVGMDFSKSKSGLSNLNLGEMLRSTSLSELGFGINASFTDLGALGLSFSGPSGGALRDANASDFSLSGLLDPSMAELGGSERANGPSNHSSSPGGSVHDEPSSFGSPRTRNRELMEIMGDIGGGVVSSLA